MKQRDPRYLPWRSLFLAGALALSGGCITINIYFPAAAAEKAADRIIDDVLGKGGSAPANIHDAMWGILSAVQGGAIHPTAEGHAAMADAALPAVREALGVATEPPVHTDPLSPPVKTDEQR